jgi:hypothetical protein
MAAAAMIVTSCVVAHSWAKEAPIAAKFLQQMASELLYHTQ